VTPNFNSRQPYLRPIHHVATVREAFTSRNTGDPVGPRITHYHLHREEPQRTLRHPRSFRPVFLRQTEI
jgi:hypothetical protein